MTAEDADNLIVEALLANGGDRHINDAAAGHLVTFQKVVRSGARDTSGDLPPEVWDHRDVAATLSPFDLGSPARAVELVVSARSVAVRGRDGGSTAEVGPEDGPAFTLRAGDGGSSRSQLIAVSATGTRTHALTSEGHDASEDGTGRGCPIVAATHAISTQTVVRRLTPLECERLQGAPDGWTDTGQADSPRYRQLGNAVAVPVFEWVGRRLAAVDATIRVSQETP